jgi:hypothetical protein
MTQQHGGFLQIEKRSVTVPLGSSAMSVRAKGWYAAHGSTRAHAKLCRVSDLVEQGNALLREKGYKESQLGVFASPLAGKVLLKGPKILSPFADSPETVLRAVRDCLPPADELGKRTLTPHELRDCLEG